MLIASYNNQSFNDLLVVLLENSTDENQHFERKEDITQLTDKKSGAVVGYNFLY